MPSELNHEYHRAKCESFARKVAALVGRDEIVAFDVTLEYYVVTETSEPWERVSVAPADGGRLSPLDVAMLQTIWQARNGQPDQTAIGGSGEFEVI